MSTNNPGQALPRPLAVLALTTGGQRLAQRLAQGLGAEVLPVSDGLSATTSRHWSAYRGFLFIMAAGIVVRAIAPLISDKKHDPAVVVMDEQGRHAVSLISGHLGGANRLAHAAARLTGGRAVITTASDTLGRTAIDLWARHHGLRADGGSFTTAAAAIVNQGRLAVYSDLPGEFPPEFTLVPAPERAQLVLSHRLLPVGSALVLRPPVLYVGIGCNRGTPAAEISAAVDEACARHRLAPKALAAAATIDIKRDEAGLIAFAGERGLDLLFFDAAQINRVAAPSSSATVYRHTGAYGVAEPAALLAAATDQLLVRKMKWKNVTIAIALGRPRITAASPSWAPAPAGRNI